MSLSHSRDQESGSAALPEDAASNPPRSPEHASFTSFPGGEGATDPDIPSEPMLNKLYNKVLSLTGTAKPPTQSQAGQQQGTNDANPSLQDSGTGLGISLGSAHQSKSPSLTSFSAAELPSVSSNQPQPLTQPDSNSNRQATSRPVERSPDVLDPVMSPVHAVGGLIRSEDEFSNLGSEKVLTDTSKSTPKSRQREINLPSLPGFRLTREPSSDSESISSFSVHPNRTVKSIIGRLKTGDLGREFWMKDETSQECFLCGEKFTSSISFLTYLTIAFRRRHHCRICGRIFDDKCTSHIPGSRFGLQEKIRVCNSCNSIMDEYDDLETQENGIIVSKSLANV